MTRTNTRQTDETHKSCKKKKKKKAMHNPFNNDYITQQTTQLTCDLIAPPVTKLSFVRKCIEIKLN